MNIFKFRDQLIDEYRSYVTSFIKIADPRIRDFAESCFSKGALWPEPLIQLNPTFKPGKSLAYMVPIVDRVLHDGSGKGIRAIIIYPMNALANSQHGELQKFLHLGFPDKKGPVTFQRYTGQEDDETRNQIIAHPPDILLTTYVMLELILTRPREQKLIASAKELEFLVLDELHTYRGRQGACVC